MLVPILAGAAGAALLLVPGSSRAASRRSTTAFDEYDIGGQQPTKATRILWWDPSAMKTSDAGLDAIKRREGFRAEAYDDGFGYLTIGYGHRIAPEERDTLTTVSFAKAYDLLRDDVSVAESAILASVTVALTQYEFDALVSLVYNIGNGAWKRSTLLKKLNQGDRAGAAAEFGRWVYAKGKRVAGLAARRADELAQFRGAV